MKVTVKLFATLRENRFSVEDREYDENVTVREIVESIGVSEKDAAIIMINGRHVDLDRVLCSGDVLAIFPPIGGG